MASEQELSEDEKSELSDLLPEGHQLLDIHAPLHSTNDTHIILRIERTIKALRKQQIPEDQANDTAFALGILMGEYIRETIGWEWKYVTQDNGFASYGVVSKDRAYVYYAMKDIYDLLTIPEDELNLMLLVNMIKAGSFPENKNKRYISLG